MQKHANILWSATTGGILKTNLITGHQSVSTRASANLPSNNIVSLTLDSIGRIWLLSDASWSSVSIFDGWGTYNFSLSDCPIKPGTAKIIETDNNGDIWVGTNTDSIYMFSSNKWYSYAIPYDSNEYFKSIIDIKFDNQNNIWLNSGNKLFKFDKNNWDIVSNSLNDSILNLYGVIFEAIDVKSNGSVWCISRKGLLKYQNNNWTIYDDSLIKISRHISFCFDDNDIGWLSGYLDNPIPFAQDIPIILKIDNNIVSKLSDKLNINTLYYYNIVADSGKLYLNTFINKQPGICVVQDSIYNVINNINDPIPSNGISFVHISKDNRKYILASNKLVVSKDFLAWDTILNINSSIAPFTKRSVICESADSSLWIAGMDSLLKIKNNLITGYDYTSASSIPFFIAIDVDQNGVVWTSSAWANNGLRTFDGQNWNKINGPNSTDVFSSLRFDNSGKLWLGTYGHGIYSYKNGVWTPYNYSWVMYNATISQILVGKNNDLWFSAEDKGIIHKNSSGVWKTYNYHNSGLISDTVYDLAVDYNGTLYIATNMGISIFDGHNWDTITTVNSRLPSDHITSIAFDTVGNLWIGTASGGLAVYKQNGLVLPNMHKYAGQSNLKIFPNPTSGELIVDAPNIEVSEINVYDIQGKFIKQFTKLNEKSFSHRINLQGITKGVYIIVIESKYNSFAKKIVIQ